VILGVFPTYPPTPIGDLDTTLRIYETEFLELVETFPLPNFPADAGEYGEYGKPHARFVFATSTFDVLHVIAQRESDPGSTVKATVIRLER
jgi:hypothetical protein